MFRQTVLAAAMLTVLVSPRAFALGMGDIDMRSALNQPMDAVIELTSATDADLDQIQVSMASLQDHARIGMQKAAILANFRFSVEKNKAGKPVIRISSEELVREPYLEFLLELDWPRGRLLRQYTVLVDPPVTMQATPAVPAAPVSRPVAAPVPAVVESRDRILDFRTRLFAHVRFAIDDARNSLDRYSGQFGDVINGGFRHAWFPLRSGASQEAKLSKGYVQ